jgi:hypothetical protein
MALAPFFDKIAQSASGLLTGFDPAMFEAHMSGQRIAVAFDSGDTREARVALELAVDLLGRLYPAIDIIPLRADPDQTLVASELLQVLRGINPKIEGSTSFSAATTASLVVGSSPAPWSGLTPTVYIGSEGWVAKVSSENPAGSGVSANPFGAGAAATVGAANIFRVAFGAQLRRGELDRNLAFSLIDYDPKSTKPCNPVLPVRIDLGETFLVGVGAVGHAAIWAWSRTPGLRGTIRLIDGETYDDTNPQRYVGTLVTDIPKLKADHAAMLLNAGLSADLAVIPHPCTWDEFLAERGNYDLDRVTLALDSAEDRIFAQASLPRVIINSWTQADNLGVSRHDFQRTACVACLYLPTAEAPNLDELVAGTLNFVGDDGLRLVRQYLDTEQPLDRVMLARIAQQTGVSQDALLAYDGAPLLALYQRAACGGAILQLGGHLGAGTKAMEVPMAFQSALAGIMLAAETIIDAAGLRSQEVPVRTEVDLLRPVTGTLCTPESKHPSGRCICQDPDFLAAYQAKYQTTLDVA